MTVVFAAANGFEQRVRDAARYRCASHRICICRAEAAVSRVQALPTACRFERLYRLPLTRLARPVVVPYDPSIVVAP